MEVILIFAYSVFFLFLIRKLPFFKTEGIPAFWLGLVFLAKVLAGIAMGWIYSSYYTDRSTADTFKFFDDSAILFNSLSDRPYDFIRMFTGFGANAAELRPYYESMNAWLNTDVLFNDNKTIIRLNTFFRFFSLGYYNVHVVFINFISFIGLFCLFKTFLKVLPERKKELFLFTFLIPSVMFWGSGLLKDGLLLFALGLVLWSLYKMISGNYSTGLLLLFLFSFSLLLFTKFYVIVSIFPGLLALLWARNKKGLPALSRFLIVYLIFFIAAFNIHYLFPDFRLTELIYWKQKNFYVLAELTRARSVIEIPRLEMSAWSLISNAPQAVITTLFRPFLGDAGGNPFILLAALENLLIGAIFVLVISNFRKDSFSDGNAFFYFCLIFVVLMFMLIGLITPILGAMVRYKVPALPFLLFVAIGASKTEKIHDLFPIFKNKK